MIAFGPLVTQTVQAPAQAASQLLALRIPREGVWTAFALVQVLNALVFTLQTIVTPLPSELMQFISPLQHLIANSVLQLTLTASITAIGRWMNGQGGFLAVLSCQVWINFVQILALVGLIFLTIVTPFLAGILGYALAIFALYVSAQFISQVHQLGSAWRGFGVLVLALLTVVAAIAFVGRAFLPGT
ncbi:hypothetical protein KMP13_00455 [Epibacterium ulvae]|jgi:hypothetical protein|uniref:YIP1 family protein n=1 Tax=Epibacterium ulvae TaxID=1156985 RepID=UPI001BFBFBE4|nr:YIP1 family protein [Epibacterium ulvae]MBT8152391.1 hypothetical protein [Epibacterium ulvae]